MGVNEIEFDNEVHSLINCLSELSTADEDIVRQALTDEFATHLPEYTDDIRTQLSTAHRSVVDECLENAEELTKLYNAIHDCDKVFERLEEILVHFQTDLGTISRDMKNLQEKSALINQELDNRQRVRGEMSQFIDDIVVPQQMIKVIVDHDANDRIFLEHLHELHRKIQYVRSHEHKEARAIEDVEPILEGLKLKALEKCRDWIIIKISQFRKPLSNYQVPQHQMLKSRFFYEFLMHHDAVCAAEVQDEYVDSVGKMFFSYFKVYSSRLFKLMMVDSAGKDDLLGVEDVTKATGLTSFFSSKPQVRNRATVFSLGNRHSLLTDDFLAPLIIPHAAKEANEKFQFESLFRSIHFALVDHCSHEFLFLADFFLVSGPIAVELHKRVLSRALNHLLRAWDEKVSGNFDAISLYLCVCLCQKFSNLLTDREIPNINSYWEEISGRLWQRLETVMLLHNESVKSLDVRRMQPPPDTRPHYIVRRYAELTCALLVITEMASKETMSKLITVLETNEDAVELLIQRLASTQVEKRDQLICIINNYDVILGILDERVARDSRIRTIFFELGQKAISEFVDVSLAPYFGEVMSFVADCEPLIDQHATKLLERYNDRLSSVVTHFNQTWKRSLDLINSDVLKSFTNFRNGTNILQSAFSQLVTVYQRFIKVSSHDAFQNCPNKESIINIHHIMVELKKYKPVF